MPGQQWWAALYLWGISVQCMYLLCSWARLFFQSRFWLGFHLTFNGFYCLDAVGSAPLQVVKWARLQETIKRNWPLVNKLKGSVRQWEVRLCSVRSPSTSTTKTCQLVHCLPAASVVVPAGGCSSLVVAGSAHICGVYGFDCFLYSWISFKKFFVVVWLLCRAMCFKIQNLDQWCA